MCYQDISEKHRACRFNPHVHPNSTCKTLIRDISCFQAFSKDCFSYCDIFHYRLVLSKNYNWYNNCLSNIIIITVYKKLLVNNPQTFSHLLTKLWNCSKFFVSLIDTLKTIKLHQKRLWFCKYHEPFGR